MSDSTRGFLLEKYLLPKVLDKRGVKHTRRIKIAQEYKLVSFYAIQDDRKRAEARDLLNERYGWRGYGSNHNLHSDTRHTTFVAEIDERVVGTMTLAIDSDHGLAIDHTFADTVAPIRRRPGSSICELTKLAFDDNIRSKDVLAGLFHLAFIYGTSYTDCTDLFIEVNPRHVRFYEMMLSFRTIGHERTNISVDAPSQLMRIEVETIRNNILEMAGASVPVNTRSLYPYFFPFEEERQVRRLLDSAMAASPTLQRRLFESADSRLDADIQDRADASGEFEAELMRSAA